MPRLANQLRQSIPLYLALLLLLACTATAQAAQPPVGLGTAGSFAVLGGSTVTNTGPSVITGDLGVSPGTAITGLPPGTVNGTVHAADAVAAQAQSDVTTAYNDAAGRIPAVVVPGDLGGLLLTPGVYKQSSSLLLTGSATLDAQGDPSAVFIFQVGSTLTTASSSRVLLAGGAQSCNVFWQIGSSATIGTGTAFVGNIFALQSITMTTGATLQGRALARNGAVTLDTNTISRADCATAVGAGTALLTTTPRSVARTVARSGTNVCVGPFRASVTGRFIRRVTFLLDGRRVRTVSRAPFQVLIRALGGIHRLRARVSFTDGTPTRNINFRFRECAQAARRLPGVTG